MKCEKREKLEELICSERLERDIGQDDVPSYWRNDPQRFLQELVDYYEGDLPRNQDGSLMDNETYESQFGSANEDAFGRTNSVRHWRDLNVYLDAKAMLGEFSTAELEVLARIEAGELPPD